jgi:nucleoid-associated protein YgaU
MYSIYKTGLLCYTSTSLSYKEFFMNLTKRKHILPVLVVLVALLGMASCKSTAEPAALSEPTLSALSEEVARDSSPESATSTSSAPQSQPTVATTPVVSSEPLPAQYMVRPWSVSEDTFKSIAARPWVYGDESEWQRLYNANRSKLPYPNNPDMLMPGIVLDIPSMEGETRSGLWEEGVSYTSLSRILATSIPEGALPAKYRVRPWSVSQDTFQSIAGRPWAYSDATKWWTIYNANRNKLPQPDNPDLLMPGIMLDIPSIQGELRAGMWDPERSYTPLVPTAPSGW